MKNLSEGACFKCEIVGMPIRKNWMDGLTTRQCNINSTKVENVELMRICRLKKQLEDDILEKYI